jgi:hypothetical protein
LLVRRAAGCSGADVPFFVARYLRQQVAQRHSTERVPSGSMTDDRCHPVVGLALAIVV